MNILGLRSFKMGEKKEDEVKIIRVVCLRDTSDHERLYERGKVYDLPSNHPCLKWFKLADEVVDPANPGPAPTEGNPSPLDDSRSA